jgi:hypothetical protein
MMQSIYDIEITVANLFTLFEWENFCNATRKQVFMKLFDHQQTFDPIIIILLDHSSIFQYVMCTAVNAVCSKVYSMEERHSKHHSVQEKCTEQPNTVTEN